MSLILALAGTDQHYRQGASWSSLAPSAASFDNSDSSLRSGLEPYTRDSTPPNDDSSDEKNAGSGDHPPSAPVFDLFHDFPTLHLDKAVDTGNELIRDEDNPPPPPPPSFPTPVEDGDAFPILPLVIKHLFKTQNVASTPCLLSLNGSPLMKYPATL